MSLPTYEGLEYLDANPGAERVALVLHWGGASARVGLPFAHLLPGWRVLAPSLRGHGRNPRPTAPADVCGADVCALLRHLGITRIDRLYAYSLGGYVATRLFGAVEIARGALLAGGVVPFRVAVPDALPAENETAEAEATGEAVPETAAWLAGEHDRLETLGRPAEEVEREWAMVRAVIEDILDLSAPRLTFRLGTAAMRPALESIWNDDYFAAPNVALPERLLFWNGNDPVKCRPYIERFSRHPSCREVTLDVDPFDASWAVVARVIALLAE